MLELDDIQALALRVQQHAHARQLSLQFADAAGARAWLRALLPAVTSAAAADRQPPVAAAVAFSAAGLAALGLPAAQLASFPEEFRAGIAARAQRLGDVGRHAHEHWDPAFAGGRLHALLWLSAASASQREQQDRALGAGLAAAHGVRVLGARDADALTAPGNVPGAEHFGYRVGISQPALEGDVAELRPGQGVPLAGGGWRRLAAGEFVLGAPDESGQPAPVPEPAALGRNGSFLVLRVLAQDVAGFRAFLRENAPRLGSQERVAAALVGRWRSGAPLALAPEQDDPVLGADPVRSNDFDFAQDPRGLRCPLGAHIRRMNPRAGSTGSPFVDTARHRLLQRGLPYGPPLPEGAADDGAERGALLLLVCASLARQYEFVQAAWANSGDFIGLGGERDPLIGSGAAADASASFTVPRRPLRLRLHGLPAFATVRGGAYCFLPSLSGLRFLCA